MSGFFDEAGRLVLSCQCPQRETRGAWRVIQRRCNYSAFNGYRRTPSDYSRVECVRALGGCGKSWRTKANYVNKLADWREEDG